MPVTSARADQKQRLPAYTGVTFGTAKSTAYHRQMKEKFMAISQSRSRAQFPNILP